MNRQLAQEAHFITEVELLLKDYKRTLTDKDADRVQNQIIREFKSVSPQYRRLIGDMVQKRIREDKDKY